MEHKWSLCSSATVFTFTRTKIVTVYWSDFLEKTVKDITKVCPTVCALLKINLEETKNK